jgi:Zn-dependent M28 family amino/carboxypeptidase
VTAAICTTSLVVAGTEATAAPNPNADSKKFRKAVTPGGISLHLDAFQEIADAHGGSRASGTPGYNASRDYIVNKLRAAGYKPRVQTFQFPFFSENADAELQRIEPELKNYATPADFSTLEYSGSGDVTAAVVPVDTDLSASDTSTSGCEADDFENFPAGSIALMQRGTCSFGQKAANAEAAEAAGVIIFNRGTEGNTESFNGTLGEPLVDIPAVGTSFAVGQELGEEDTTARVFTDTTSETRTTSNVTAETKKGNADRVIMAGAHLDSVPEGAGINDNGSGSGTVLELAEELAKEKKLRNKVRFAWWGAEESGLLGAEHYVADLAENDPATLDEIGAYLNFDMVGSPNYVRFVYDGDNSENGTTTPPPPGSGDIEQLFTRYFTNQRLTSEPTAFNGRSDYGPFIENGVPAGGLFTGAEGIKTAAEAREYGGVAGVAYDPCYHSECDDRDNISNKAIDEMSDAAAHVLWVLAQNRGLVQDNTKMKKSTTGAKVRAKDRTAHADLR